MKHLLMQFAPFHLLCNSQMNPLSVGTPQPVFSWKINATGFSRKQTAFRLIASSTIPLLETCHGDLWDSGIVNSCETLNIEYRGKTLSSRQECYWKVQLWDEQNRASEWSDVAFFKIGLLCDTDWTASWISFSEEHTSNAPWFKKSFEYKNENNKAFLYINVAGYFEVYINGVKIGKDVLSPAVCDFSKKTFYKTIDVSEYLKMGQNVIGLWMGRGWYVPNIPGVIHENPVARLQLELDGTNASPFKDDLPLEIIATDSSWKTKESPYSLLGAWKWNNYGGERFDSRMICKNWNSVDCNDSDKAFDHEDSGWKYAVQVTPLPVPAVPVESPPNEIHETLHAISMIDLGDGFIEIDFGKNLTGWVEMEFPKLERDYLCKIWYADKKHLGANVEDEVYQFGTLKRTSSDKSFQTNRGTFCYQVYNQCDEFISAGIPGEIFCSKFNYHGFRYVILDTLSTKPKIEKIKAHLIESALKQVGHFSCSNELLNQIHQTNLRTIRCLNLGSYMVDCPHRERFGYGGDGHVSVEAVMMNLDAHLFYRKWFYDWVDAQNEAGMIPGVSPDHHGRDDYGPCWAGLSAVLGWKIYFEYNDKTVLHASRTLLKKYLTYLNSFVEDNILLPYGGQWGFLGDWVEPGKGLDTNLHKAVTGARVDDELFNNCYHIYLWSLYEKFSGVLGESEEEKLISEKIIKMRTTLHKKYFNPETSSYAGESEISQAFPLFTDIVPDDKREAVYLHLRKLILETRNGHLDTGMDGTYFLIQMLQETDNELVYSIINQTTYPGWGYLLQSGATVFGEQWNGFWSQIHACLLSPGGWFYEGVAGIKAIEPGFRKIRIKPAFLTDLTYARASHSSPVGEIFIDWEKTEMKVILRVTIPANTTAEIHLPAKDTKSVLVNGELLSAFTYGTINNQTEEQIIYNTGSGNYVFEILES